MARSIYFAIAFVLLVGVASTFAENEEKYDSKYDNIDVDMILANSKLRNQYLKCYLETGPCAEPAAKHFKTLFPEAFVTKCKKCTDKQVMFFDKVSAWFMENEPDVWKQIVEKAMKTAQEKGLKTEEK